MMILRLSALALIALFAQPAPYRAEIEKFRANRQQEINGEAGWNALVGLHWMEPGAHTIGRAATNAIVLNSESAPPVLGTITVSRTGAALAMASGVVARSQGKPVTTVGLTANAPAKAGVTVGSLTLVLIKRGDRFALRVWDASSPARKAFTGLKWAPIDTAWRVTAEWMPHTPAGKAKILNVLGETVEMANPGAARFSVGGQTYTLEAFLEGADAKELFFIIRDGTSGKTTYEAGRYLYTPLAKDGHVTLDFNRLINPPCAFTAFATCPLPPASNKLTLSIAAGELKDGHQ
jgi:uncharacterized protein (DUF1684 family)